MALSDHDQTVLQEMEAELRSAFTPATRRRSANVRIRPHLIAAIGLLIAGAGAIAAGLGLADVLGTALGVLGFVLIVASGWSASHLLASLRGWVAARRRRPTEKPR